MKDNISSAFSFKKRLFLAIKNWLNYFKDPVVRTFRIGIILKLILALITIAFIPYRLQIFFALSIYFTIDYFVDKKIFKLTHEENGTLIK